MHFLLIQWKSAVKKVWGVKHRKDRCSHNLARSVFSVRGLTCLCRTPRCYVTSSCPPKKMSLSQWKFWWAGVTLIRQTWSKSVPLQSVPPPSRVTHSDFPLFPTTFEVHFPPFSSQTYGIIRPVGKPPGRRKEQGNQWRITPLINKRGWP